MTGHFVHPFDDDRFIAGNATAGLEILEDLPDVDAIVAPLGGGGLLAGIAAAVGELKPDTRVYAAEPETAAPLAASLAAGRPVYFDGWQASFVDGAGGKSVLRDDVAAARRSCRIDRRVARRGGARDEAGGRAGARHRRRRGRLRRRRRAQRTRRRAEKSSPSSPAATSISRSSPRSSARAAHDMRIA